MTYKLRALMFALAAVVFIAPAAMAADMVGGADVEVPPGVSSVDIDIETDNNLRGVGFSVVLENVDAASATLNGVTVNLTELGSRRLSGGDVFLAANLGGGDDLAAGLYAGAVSVEIDVQGVTGNTARLIVCGVNPWPDNVIFVGDEDSPSRNLISCDTILVTVKAGAAILVDGVCPNLGETYEDGAVAVQVSAQINDGVFQSLDLIDVLKDGASTVPTNAPVVTGLGLIDAPDATSLITYWEPAAGEAGTWTFCFEATNDLGDADTSCVDVEVLAPSGDHMRWQSEHIEYTAGVGPFPYTMNLDFTVSDNTQGVVGPFRILALTGAALDAQITDLDAGFSPAMDVFESKSTQNPTYAFDGVADSVLMGLIDFGGTDLVPGNYPAAYFINSTLQEAEGIINIDSTFLSPANEITYNQTGTPALYPTYSPGCYALTIIRNIAPIVICPVDDAGTAIFGDLVSVPGFTCDDPDASPQPCTFSVVSAEKDGAPATPTNAPTFNGDTFEWQTSNADNNDVGVWEFCVIANDGADNSTNECCFTVEVIAQVPLVCFGIGSAEAPTGTDLCVPLSIVNLAGATDGSCKELGGFDLLFTYDPTIVTFTGIDLDGSVLETAGWEYLTYRIEGMNPPLIRIVAIADMNNSNQHPNEFCIDGLLANLCFRTTTNLDLGCMSAPISFYWNDCGDNAASSRDGNTLYVVTDPFGATPWFGGDPTAIPPIPGGGIISNSESIQGQLFTGDGGTGGLLCLDPDPDPNKPTPEECLYFVNGKIKITCPGDLDDRGDLNLNGLAYEISDAVLYSNYFIQGPSVFTVNVAGQTAASDVNADGTPLTVADLVYLIRVITGDAEPIAEDLLGGGPKVAAVVGAIGVTSAQQGANVSVSINSEYDMGAGLFVYKYEGAEIADVQAVGHASHMNVKYEAANGELRILVLPHMSEQIEKSRVAAGVGEILNIATQGVGTVELVSVEAATFMGGTLEATVEAKVLPTAYALHQNFPNPFNPSTSMAIDFPNASEYTLTIYNIAGQVVKTYAGQAEAGTHTITWDGSDNRGSQVASGVYFYRIDTELFNAVRKMALVR